MLAGDKLCHADRGLVGLGPGGNQQNPIQPRCQFRQTFGQCHHRAGQHAAKQMGDLFDLALHGFDDFRVSVTQKRTHLTRCEIQNGAIIGIINEGSLGAFDDGRFERAAVADQVFLGGVPEFRIGVA